MQGLRPCQQAQFLEHKNIKTYLSCPEKVTFFDSLSRDSKNTWTAKKRINSLSCHLRHISMFLCIILFIWFNDGSEYWWMDQCYWCQRGWNCLHGAWRACCSKHISEGSKHFLSKNSSLSALIVLSVGLTSVDGVDLINLKVDPWKSLPTNTTKPQKDDYMEEISPRYVAENLFEQYSQFRT